MSPEDQVKAWRYYSNDGCSVFVFKYGTSVLAADETQALAVMREYNVPWDGEGSPMGDMDPLPMKNGNTIVFFAPVQHFVQGRSIGATCILTPEDLKGEPLVPQSATEVFPMSPSKTELRERVRLLRFCLLARANRGKDARDPEIVARWEKPN